MKVQGEAHKMNMHNVETTLDTWNSLSALHVSEPVIGSHQRKARSTIIRRRKAKFDPTLPFLPYWSGEYPTPNLDDAFDAPTLTQEMPDVA